VQPDSKGLLLGAMSITLTGMGKKLIAQVPARGKPSALLDTRVIYCGDCLEQLRNLPDARVDLIYIDPPFNSNRNYEVFWGDTTPALASATEGKMQSLCKAKASS
jgi:16S rRNA G966 N2-methylase RsmD